MSDKAFRVQCIPDSKFWERLANSPSPNGSFPEVMTLGKQISFSYAPFNALDGYADWGDPQRALHYVVPPTPAPIRSIGYLVAPPSASTKQRRVFVAFFYGPGQAVLAETHPMTLLHKPLGLRLASGIVFGDDTFTVSNVVIKGDDAPIRIAMAGKNPALTLSITEGPPPTTPGNTMSGGLTQAEAPLLNVLNINVGVPHLAALNVNLPMAAVI